MFFFWAKNKNEKKKYDKNANDIIHTARETVVPIENKSRPPHSICFFAVVAVAVVAKL